MTAPYLLVLCRTYMPPEFINRLVISKKFDIFSLGVIIIETVAGFSIYKLFQDMMPYEEIIELVRNQLSRNIINR